MAKILVLYYSSYGHIEKMAEAVAEGVLQADGCEVVVKRVPELVSEEVAKRSGYKLDQAAPLADPMELADYDGVIFGCGTRFGVMASQMRNFLDQTGALWMRGALVGKVGSGFTSTGTQHGGQETTLISLYVSLLHQGMVIVGLPYSFGGLTEMEEIVGGSPYGASTLTRSDGTRPPSALELEGARYQGRHVAEVTQRLWSMRV
jgi:NAD(P)H dehydrogenase (quinone)